MQLNHYESIYRVELNHWWYRVRRKLIHDLINTNTSKNKSMDILDVGCGAGALMKELEIYGRVKGVDFSDIAVSFCKSRGIDSVQRAEIENLPFPDNSFDLVLALDVLEHIPNDEAGMKEIYRVLRPGGRMIVFVPAFMFLWGVTDESSNHFRRYNITGLSSSVEKIGFKILKKSYFNTFLFFPIASVRLLSRLLKRSVEDENSIGNEFTNKLFFYIFNAERFFLRYFAFPFGISCFVVASKNQ